MSISWTMGDRPFATARAALCAILLAGGAAAFAYALLPEGHPGGGRQLTAVVRTAAPTVTLAPGSNEAPGAAPPRSRS